MSDSRRKFLANLGIVGSTALLLPSQILANFRRRGIAYCPPAVSCSPMLMGTHIEPLLASAPVKMGYPAKATGDRVKIVGGFVWIWGTTTDFTIQNMPLPSITSSATGGTIPNPSINPIAGVNPPFWAYQIALLTADATINIVLVNTIAGASVPNFTISFTTANV